MFNYESPEIVFMCAKRDTDINQQVND